MEGTAMETREDTEGQEQVTREDFFIMAEDNKMSIDLLPVAIATKLEAITTK